MCDEIECEVYPIIEYDEVTLALLDAGVRGSVIVTVTLEELERLYPHSTWNGGES